MKTPTTTTTSTTTPTKPSAAEFKATRPVAKKPAYTIVAQGQGRGYEQTLRAAAVGWYSVDMKKWTKGAATTHIPCCLRLVHPTENETTLRLCRPVRVDGPGHEYRWETIDVRRDRAPLVVPYPKGRTKPHAVRVLLGLTRAAA